MIIDEVFPNPTVKQVIFQIRFPNLFYMENRIGDLQLAIMEEFPESALLIRRRVVLADIGPGVTLEDVADKAGEQSGTKVWQFRSPQKYQLNVTSGSLDITSEYHKSYGRPEAEHRFRDVIEYALHRFFQVARVPVIDRIGLRYIDECPVPSKETAAFRRYYNTTFPLSRFSLEEATELVFKTVAKRGDYSLRYIESLQSEGDQYKLILDFDAFARAVQPNACLEITDKLHELIIEEFGRTIKEPVLEYMRKVEG